ncbi:hypothetical protein C5167_011017 [Papaver somniferum]|uniref:Uncharacterized protein n=1 Tax=Papaver somniferum TaxID=3469 RepID=A0A4Y7K5X3_PAPSO|nr:hypothetical protein C5167_011017 [Papaver somniferum]
MTVFKFMDVTTTGGISMVNFVEDEILTSFGLSITTSEIHQLTYTKVTSTCYVKLLIVTQITRKCSRALQK